MYQFSAVIFSCIGHPFNETLSFSPQAALKVGSVMLHLSQIHFCGWNFKKDWTCCSIRFISYIYDVCVCVRKMSKWPPQKMYHKGMWCCAMCTPKFKWNKTTLSKKRLQDHIIIGTSRLYTNMSLCYSEMGKRKINFPILLHPSS